MSTMRFNFRSQAVGRHVDVTITMPTDEYSYQDTGSRPKTAHPLSRKTLIQYRPGIKFQTVYLLHGGGDDDTLLFRYTNAERYASKNHVMLVSPNLANSFGADTEYGVNYDTFLSKELPVVIQSLFPSSPLREDNFVVGHAMGGNIALAQGIFHPENYAACVDLSGGIGYTLRTDTMVNELRSRALFQGNNLYGSTFGPAEKFAGSRHDLAARIKSGLSAGVRYPKFTLVCGSKEFIRERVEGDVNALKELGVDMDYIVAEGYDHDFDLWDLYFRKTFDEILPLRHAPILPD